ncbi:hypothetical protein N7507_005034 [Penicillium longicatenatum]|nr:hypothetical protein N7507_005034 [Penicillium longicatenatum]
MTSNADNERGVFAVSTGPFECPEVGVRDSTITFELGTEANPIVIGDDRAPLGSASNPIVIHVGENWCYDKIDQLSAHADSTRALPSTEANWDDSIAAKGTQSNAIYTENDPCPFGLAPNPVIHEDWYYETDQLSSDANTEVMTANSWRSSAIFRMSLLVPSEGKVLSGQTIWL